MDDELIAECGCQEPVHFLNATLVDAEGKDVEIPICEECGFSMSCLMGISSYKWVCNSCVTKDLKCRLIYRPPPHHL